MYTTKKMFIVDSNVLVTDGVINFTTLHTAVYFRIHTTSLAQLLIIKELHHRMYFITYVVNQLIYLKPSHRLRSCVRNDGKSLFMFTILSSSFFGKNFVFFLFHAPKPMSLTLLLSFQDMAESVVFNSYRTKNSFSVTVKRLV